MSLHIVLYKPSIIENVGNIARTCVAFNCDLHMIRPYGFIWNKSKLKRSSTNHFDLINVYEYDAWEDFLNINNNQNKIIYYYSRYGKKSPNEFKYNLKQDIYLVFGNDKQKSSSIKNIVSFWNNGQSLPIVRLFVDFKVPQKVLQCMCFQSARNDVTTFFTTFAKTTKNHVGCFPYRWINYTIRTPIVRTICSSVLRDPTSTDGIKQPILEVMKHMISFKSNHDIISMFSSELFQHIVENGNNPLYHAVLDCAIQACEPIMMQVIMQSTVLQKMFSVVNLEYVPRLDMRVFNDNLDIFDTNILIKRLISVFYIRYSTLPSDIVNQKLPYHETINFIIQTLSKIPQEATET